MNRTLLMVVVAAGVGDAALLAGEAELVPPIGVLEGLGLVRIAPVAKVGVGVHDFHVSMVLNKVIFDKMRKCLHQDQSVVGTFRTSMLPLHMGQ